MIRLLVAMTALISAGSLTLAQTVGYTINGGQVQTVTVNQTPPYSNLVISLPSPLTSNIDLHIFDVNGTGDSLNKITVRGSVAAGSGHVLRVAVATQFLLNYDSAFPDNPTQVDPGLKHLGGLEIVGPVNNPSDVSLRDRSLVSVNIQGDLTGDVTAGMIWRVDARRSQEANPANRIGGTISGNLRATRGDGAIWPFDGRQFPAIRFVRAGYQLTGDLIADAADLALLVNLVTQTEQGGGWGNPPTM